MPQRPNEHIIEHRSKVAFENALPDNWQPRLKSHDYGVDGEVEVFSPEGFTTGLLFNVQLKGTDDETKAQKRSIKIETLQYLCSMDAPAIVVRHCRPRNTLYWMWAFEGLEQIRPGSESVTLNFPSDRLWSPATAQTIERHLATIRRAKARDRLSRFHLKIAPEMSGELAIRLRRTISRLESIVPYGVFESSLTSIPVLAKLTSAQFSLVIEGVGSVSIAPSSNRDDDCLAAAIYGLVVLLGSYGFDVQAEQCAIVCARNEIVAPNRELAAHAAASLTAKPNASVDFAIQSHLHTEQDFAFTVFVMALVSPRLTSEGSDRAVVRFYEAAIEAQIKVGMPVGNLWYSLANRLRSMRSYKRAISAYNRARKAEPEYNRRAYFAHELGGVLFRVRRYSCSAEAYRHSVNLSGSQETRFLLSDALLMATDYISAAESFDHVSVAEGSLGAEARLRGYVARWLGTGQDVPQSLRYDDLIAFRSARLTVGDKQALFLAQLALTLIEFDDDPECWGEAIFFCALSNTMDALRDVMVCASSKCGLEPYQYFKDRQFLNLKPDVELVEQFDKLALEVQDQVDAEKERSGPDFTLRMF